MDEFRGEHLRRVIILDEPEHPATVKAQALELYEDGAILRWTSPGSYDHTAEKGEGLWPRLSDDVGTRYLTRGGHGGGAPRYSGEWWFVPAVPETATRLEILGLEYPVSTQLG